MKSINRKFIFSLIILTLLALSSGCLSKSSVTNSEFEIKSSWYEGDEYPYSKFEYDASEGVYTSYFNIKVTSDRDDLYFKVYDTSTGEPLEFFENKALPINSESVTVKTELKSYDRKKVLDVYVIPKSSVSNKGNFDKNTKGVVSNSFTLPSRIVNLEVYPNPLEFTIEKDRLWDTSYKTINIKNTGDLPISIKIMLPSSANKNLNYPSYKPQYLTSESKHGFDLDPGESVQYDIMSNIGNVGEYDTPIGHYSAQGTLSAFNGQYVYTFNLDTTVI